MAVKNDGAKIQQLVAERQRIIRTLKFEESSTLTVDLPLDTCLKAIGLRLSGSVVTTYASGTPVADAFSIIDNLISRIDVRVGTGRFVKSVRPYMLKMQNLLADGVMEVRRASAGATAVSFPTTDQGFVYGTSGQVTSVNEYLTLSFENVLAPIGKQFTWLNLKNRPSAQLIFSTKSFKSLQGFGNTAPVVFSDSTLQFTITSLEAQDVKEEIEFADYKQTHSVHQFNGGSSAHRIRLNRGNHLQGIMLLACEGQAGSATTATGKLRSNTLVENVKLEINGQTKIKETTFQDLQDENRRKFKVNAPMVGGSSILDGIAYLDILKEGDIRSATPLVSPLVDSAELEISLNNNADYTNPATVELMTNEIVWPQGAAV